MSDGCGGCPYCDFPYEAQLPVKTENGYETREFRSQDDIWVVIDLIAQETKEFNEDEKYMKLLNKYLYCTETGTPAHSGSYGEQPARWVQYFFIIKNAMAKKMNNVKEKAKKDV